MPRFFPFLALVASLVILWQALSTGQMDERSRNWMNWVLAGELFTFFFIVALVEVASRLEKLRARALAFDRFQTGLSGYFLDVLRPHRFADGE